MLCLVLCNKTNMAWGRMENDSILMPFISLPARYMVKNFLPLTTQQTKDILTLDLLNADTKALWGAKFPIHHTLEQLAPFECFTTPDTYSDLQWLTSLMGQLMGRTSHNLWAANISQCWRIFHISWASQHQLGLEELLQNGHRGH